MSGGPHLSLVSESARPNHEEHSFSQMPLVGHSYGHYGIYTNPNCPLCNSEEEMTEEHLQTCEALLLDPSQENIGVHKC